MLFSIYCLSFIIFFIKEKKYNAFGNKLLNFLNSIINIYFPISIWYFVFFEIQNTFYYIIEIIAGIGFIILSVIKILRDY